MKRLAGPPEPITTLRKDVPEALASVIDSCLQAEPEHRYQTMDELSADLDRVARGTVPTAIPEMMARSVSAR